MKMKRSQYLIAIVITVFLFFLLFSCETEAQISNTGFGSYKPNFDEVTSEKERIDYLHKMYRCNSEPIYNLKKGTNFSRIARSASSQENKLLLLVQLSQKSMCVLINMSDKDMERVNLGLQQFISKFQYDFEIKCNVNGKVLSKQVKLERKYTLPTKEEKVYNLFTVEQLSKTYALIFRSLERLQQEIIVQSAKKIKETKEGGEPENSCRSRGFLLTKRIVLKK